MARTTEIAKNRLNWPKRGLQGQNGKGKSGRLVRKWPNNTAKGLRPAGKRVSRQKGGGVQIGGKGAEWDRPAPVRSEGLVRPDKTCRSGGLDCPGPLPDQERAGEGLRTNQDGPMACITSQVNTHTESPPQSLKTAVNRQHHPKWVCDLPARVCSSIVGRAWVGRASPLQPHEQDTVHSVLLFFFWGGGVACSLLAHRLPHPRYTPPHPRVGS